MRWSFIIPVFNCAADLESCVRSIQAADLKDYEILLIDDGSTDGSWALCDTLAAQFSEIRALHQLNKGVSAARNLGLQEARGENLLFVDADDTLDGEALRVVLEADADLVIFGMTFDHYHRGRCYRADASIYPQNGNIDWRENFEALFAANTLSPVWNKVYKKRIVEENRLGLREDMFLYEDLEFVLRYLACCDSVWNVPRAVYHYRQSGKAGQRVARIGRISEYLASIETALNGLDLSPEIVSRIRLQLYEILAREKIAVSHLTGIREICRDFQALPGKPTQMSKLCRRLQRGNALTLKFSHHMTTLRHKIAVRVKTFL